MALERLCQAILLVISWRQRGSGVTLGLMALFVCKVCGLELQKDTPGVSRLVRGWQKHGSTAVTYAEELFEYAHSVCLSMRKNPDAQAESLF